MLRPNLSTTSLEGATATTKLLAGGCFSPIHRDSSGAKLHSEIFELQRLKKGMGENSLYEIPMLMHNSMGLKRRLICIAWISRSVFTVSDSVVQIL